MPGQKALSRSQLVRRLVIFYAIIAVIGVAVVIFVVDKGGDEKAQPAIAGGYTLAAASPCIGPVPKPAGGIPLPPTAPTQVAASGPSFNVLQSGQFVNFTNNQNTLGGKLRSEREDAPRRRPSPDRGRQLRVGRQVASPRRGRDSGRQGAITGTLGGLPFAGQLHERPARSGRGGAADADEHPGHVRAVPGLDVLRQHVLDPRHRRRRPAVLVERASCSGRSPTRARPAACSATSSASRAAPRG